MSLRSALRSLASDRPFCSFQDLRISERRERRSLALLNFKNLKEVGVCSEIDPANILGSLKALNADEMGRREKERVEDLLNIVLDNSPALPPAWVVKQPFGQKSEHLTSLDADAILIFGRASEEGISLQTTVERLEKKNSHFSETTYDLEKLFSILALQYATNYNPCEEVSKFKDMHNFIAEKLIGILTKVKFGMPDRDLQCLVRTFDDAVAKHARRPNIQSTNEMKVARRALASSTRSALAELRAHRERTLMSNYHKAFDKLCTILVDQTAELLNGNALSSEDVPRENPTPTDTSLKETVVQILQSKSGSKEERGEMVYNELLPCLKELNSLLVPVRYYLNLPTRVLYAQMR